MEARGNAHPADAVLQNYLEDRCTQADASDVGAHLEQCESCRERMELFCNAGDPLAARLRELNAHALFGNDGTRLLETGGAVTLPDGQQVLTDLENFDAEPSRRYRMFDEIAHGGMGTVIRGRDNKLQRELVLKVMRPSEGDRAEAVDRFVREAQICAQLQHPGIVAVHDLGRFEDGRPFISMKLVRGRTLKQLLAERADPQQDRQRMLGIFGHVCQTVAYAHSRGVIHRDLKPDNIMVGSFGEVQVMDWGLAKVIKDGVSADGPVTSNSRSSADDIPHSDERTQAAPSANGNGESSTCDPGSETLNGSVMGTPAYMPPEQARGEIDRIDERADVFALGAILCEILTGQPPYDGTDSDRALDRAVNTDLSEAFQRIETSGADRELIDLAVQCLASSRGDRPPNGSRLAERLAAYDESVEQRLRNAELERTNAETRAHEEQKRRRVSVALALSVLALIVVAGIGGLLLQNEWNQAERRKANRLAATERKATNALHNAQQAWIKARNSGTDAAAWDRVVTAIGHAVRMLEESMNAELRQRVLETDRDVRRDFAKARARAAKEQADRRLVARLGEARRQSTETDIQLNKMQNRRALEMFRQAIREYGIENGQPDVRRTAATFAARPEPIRKVVIESLYDWWDLARVAPNDRTDVAWLKALIDELDTDKVRRAIRRAANKPKPDRKALRKLAATDDILQESPTTLQRLVIRLLNVGAGSAANELLRRAHVRYPNNFWIASNAAERARRSRKPQLEEALRYYTACAAIQPGTPGVRVNLGVALMDLKRISEAEAQFEEAVRLNPSYSAAWFALGMLRSRRGSEQQAGEAFCRANELDPKAPRPRIMLAIFDSERDSQAAEDALRAVIAEHPRLPRAHAALAPLLLARGEPAAALRSLDAALSISAKFLPALAVKARMLMELGKLNEATVLFRRMVKLQPRVNRHYVALGACLIARRKRDEAIVVFRQLLERNPRDWNVHIALLSLYRVPKYQNARLQIMSRMTELRPGFVQVWIEWGTVLKANGRYVEALAKFTEAHNRASKNSRFRRRAADYAKDCKMRIGLAAALSATGSFLPRN